MGSISWNSLIEQAGESANTFELLPDGDYELKVLKAEVGTTGTNKPKITLTTQVITGRYANRRIWDDLTISEDSPKAMGFFFRKMKALGLDQAYFKSEPTLPTVAAALEGRTFRGQIHTDTSYGPNPKNKIRNYLPAAGGTQSVPAPNTPPAPIPGPQPPSAPSSQAQPPAAPQATPSPWEDTAGAPPRPPF